MPKRDRTTTDRPEKEEEKDVSSSEDEGFVDENEDNDSKMPPSKQGGQVKADNEEEEGEEFEDDEEDSMEEGEYDEDEDEEDEMPSSQQSFVAWLEKGATSLSVGELHFSNVEHTGSPDAPNSYCVVYEMAAVPVTAKVVEEQEDEENDEEAESPPLLYTFTNGFPFRVLPASACVGIPLEPVAPNSDTTDNGAATANANAPDEDDDDEEAVVVYTTFALEADIHQALLEDLNNTTTSSDSAPAYTKISPKWRLPTSATTTDEAVVNGVKAWWKAGEAKTGWDLQKIPQPDYTTVKNVTMNSNNNNGDDNNGDEDTNILLQLYRDLCAFQPLAADADRDSIEERFEWRTCLCTYFAWAVPNEEALQLLQKMGKPILEIGAGTGYWAWVLSNYNKIGGKGGIDIVAYDMKESHGGHKHRFRHGLVKDGGVEQASSKEHKGRALFLCWPDIVGDSATDDADRGTFGVDTLQAYKGDTVIYVGELGPDVVRANTKDGWGDPFPPGGSSASAAFQTELHGKFRLTDRVQLPNWPPYNSHLTVWVRK